MSTTTVLLVGLVLCCAALPSSAGRISVPSIFSENMVLQRDVSVPVWGWAPDGVEVTVSIEDQKVKTTAVNGEWRVALKPLKAGGPYTLMISTDDLSDTVMLSQVMVGEVWITAGQSNAIMTVEQSDGYNKAVAERFKYPNIRVVLISNRMPHLVETPQKQFTGYWGPLKWENSIYTIPRSSGKDIPGGSSALSYYFARELCKFTEGKIPIGMIELGAILKAEAWVDDNTVANTPEMAELRGKPYPVATSRAYNAEVAPLAPFPVRGVIYYQGEMNAGTGHQYRSTLPALIKSWRKAWGNPDMPFIIVQLPGFIKHMGPDDKRLDMDKKTFDQFKGENINHGYCTVREAQLMTWQKTPNTGMAITVDLGDPYDIHPKRKREVSERVFLQARQLVYGDKDVVASGPVPDRFEVKDGRFVVSFKYTGTGLKVKGKQLEGFEVSADGKTFVTAKAAIEGDTVSVWSPDVASPKAVRYAWAGYPSVSLYNSAGLPATPFRYPMEP